MIPAVIGSPNSGTASSVVSTGLIAPDTAGMLLPRLRTAYA
jgi:hypothetical protein